MGHYSEQGKKALILPPPAFVISIILYLGLIVVMGKTSANESYRIFGHHLSSIAAKGVMTQFQMLILVFVVLRATRTGYLAAMALNGLSIVMSVLFMVRTNSMIALPGLISYAGVMLILTLIYSFRQRISSYIEKTEKQRNELEKSEIKLKQMAYYDSLTGLPNRSLFKEVLSRDISLSQRNGTMMTVVFIDLDSFKDINDTLGHNAGDEALVQISRRITSVMRGEDILSRFGGDEFLMSAVNIHSANDTKTIGGKILGVFRDPLILRDREFFITASIGISVFPYDGNNAEQLIKNADMAMYLAKKQGKNGYAFCTREMRDDSRRTLSLTNHLYRALDKGELYVEYQPQIQTETREIIGFEALLRWKNGEYGFVSPGEFIPIAEHTGLIRPIGLWVMREVCLKYKDWADRCARGIGISFNVSVEQLKDDGIMEQIGSVLKETGVPASALEVEVTESAAFGDSYDIIDKLVELKKMGFKIAIDDFGKEYSSLNRIRAFPVDRIKIDMDFVHGISSGDSKDRAVVKTIIQLGRNLGVKVIAEGVETWGQYEFLKEETCDEVQGFLFYKSMSPGDIDEHFSCGEESLGNRA